MLIGVYYCMYLLCGSVIRSGDKKNKVVYYCYIYNKIESQSKVQIMHLYIIYSIKKKDIAG